MANAQFFFALRGEETDTLELDVYDVIGGGYWEEGTTARNVRRALKSFKGSTIKLRVNSPGGSVIDGFAIYNLLNEHPARVEADIDALAASMASVIIMAADEIRMAPNALIMIHNPWSVEIGEADDMRRMASLLDKMRDQIADAYAARTGQTRAKLLELMAAETWMTAAEAKELGFADKVKPAKKGKSAAKSQAQAFASLRLDGFSAVPEALRQAVERARQEVSGSAADREDNGDDDVAEEQSTMADEIKNLLATLGVASVAELSGRLSLLARMETAAGKTGDEAHGVVLAALASHAEVPKLQARIEELQKQGAASALDAFIAKAKDEKKLTPALEKTLRDQFAAGDISLKGAEAFLANLPAISAMQPKSPAAPAGGDSSTLTWNGKSYADLKPAQRAALKHENPELFEAMRSSAQN